MRRKLILLAVVLALVFILAVLVLKNLPHPTANKVLPANNVPLLTLDCVTNHLCPELLVQGDAAARLPNGNLSNFRGFADPTIRQDPVTGRLWMAYSWPNVHALGPFKQVPGVDTHLASSDDGGKHWNYEGKLWYSQKDTNKDGSGKPGYTDHEVPNILPRRAKNKVVWYGARLDYFLPEVGGFKKRPPSSFRIKIMEASSPKQLATAPTAALGSAVTSPGWGVDINLSLLSQEVQKCHLWNEPALYFENDSLYLVLHCLTFNGKTPNVSEADLVVFATNAEGEPRYWKWRYVGKLAAAPEAKELGAPGLTQIDIAKGKDGQLLAIVTLNDWDKSLNDFVHYGCKAVEISSMDPPRLARNSSGSLKVRAMITASDQTPLGPGACAYDPGSSTGIVMVRREKGRGFMTTSMHKTKVSP